jgi:hypothetical protein
VGEGWASLLGGAVLALASGFGAWMFRIDRAVGRIAHLAEGLVQIRDAFNEALRETRADNDREHQDLRQRIDQHSERLGEHAERITRLEPRTATRSQHCSMEIRP